MTIYTNKERIKTFFERYLAIHLLVGFMGLCGLFISWALPDIFEMRVWIVFSNVIGIPLGLLCALLD